MRIRRLTGLAVASVAAFGFAAAPVSADAASAIQITRVYVNSPGTDSGSNTSLNGEYVRIKNTSKSAKSLAGYTLRDESRHIYTFSNFRLAAGATVTVHSGTGRNTSTNLYWQKRWYVWNNSGGDSATLRTSTGASVDRCAWKTVASYVNC